MNANDYNHVVSYTTTLLRTCDVAAPRQRVYSILEFFEDVKLHKVSYERMFNHFPKFRRNMMNKMHELKYAVRQLHPDLSELFSKEVDTFLGSFK